MYARSLTDAVQKYVEDTKIDSIFGLEDVYHVSESCHIV
jgi:hypothetical protein